MNTMEVTKIVAALCGTLLVFLLINFFTEFLYASDEGHGGERHDAYVIATHEEGGDAHEEAAEPEVDFAALMAEADPAAGESKFKPCAACHKLDDGVNGLGPYLYGVVGRDVGSADGYKYSEELTTIEGDWTPEALSGFLANPKEYAPGTKMVFRGMKDAQDRANLIAYLDSVDD